MTRRWRKFTQFIKTLWLHLDNNIVEQALKLIIRYRKVALFFRTEHSAYIGSIPVSLIYTCQFAKANAADYLEKLQANKSSVFQGPASWPLGITKRIFLVLYGPKIIGDISGF